MRFFSKSRRRPDYVLIAAIVFLILFGLAMLASASSNLGEVRFGDPYYFLKRQASFGLAVGTLGFIVGATVHYKSYRNAALIFLLLSFILVALVFTPLGFGTTGATRWLSLGPLSFQPSEILKITLVIYLAAWLSRESERQKSFSRGVVPFLIVIGGISGLLLGQPSTSMLALLIAAATIMYFMSGAKLRYIAGIVGSGILVIGIMVFVASRVTPGPDTDYRILRIRTFLGLDRNEAGEAFHIRQAKIAIGSGGIGGVGYGQSTTKIRYLPEPMGDSIFAVIAEELGFIGATTIIAVFGVLVLRMLILARRARDKFGGLILVGFASVIALQVFIHIGAISGIIPLTGIPLPFVSYGSTALAVFMTMGGIAVNISKYV